MLSNYPSELLDRYIEANGWKSEGYTMDVTARQKSGKKKTEVLIMNYEPQPKLF